ncbi:MAG: 6-carboxytetrahydropterin synthase [Candidatus Atelocyanobacterium thalassa]
MKCVINRRAEFSASHRYYLPEWSMTKNEEQFGANSFFPGHGHNYVLFVSLEGGINEYGMIENLSLIKKIIKQQITDQFNYSYLNNICQEFSDTLPTTENIARIIWERLYPHLPIINIKLFEHPRLWAEYRGNHMQATLTTQVHFSAAHRLALPNLSLEENTKIYGKCARVHGHGHNYFLDVSVTGNIDERTGMIVDLEDLQNIVNDYIVEPFDHTFLNKDVPYFVQTIPTAENIALYIAQLLKEPIKNLGVVLHKVKLTESPNNSCEIYCSQLIETL